ncbi:MAG: C4-type zinc ribbon domain-containing protein [Bacteroidales bacterium]|jgi:predicted  nucleic acid-binding Zn-ribbon protein|nr:C4-type zinc ribbon domain-containing protein [Bacteroidales bacterium]
MANKKEAGNAISASKKTKKNADTEIQTEVSELKTTQNPINEESGEEFTIAEKLYSLYNLQQIWTQIDKLRTVRGELPEEINDLEDELEGIRTRIANYQEDIKTIESNIVAVNEKIKEAGSLIKRYEEQQNNVRNNREYDSLTKEIEYQKLEVQVAEKHNVKFQVDIEAKKEEIVAFEEKDKEISDTLEQKKSELDGIIADTQKEEIELLEKVKVLEAKVEERLLTAFEKIRTNARNGLGIVQIDRDACGGCFSTIPPQRQLDIRLHKKIIVCEACGRIFIDKQLVASKEEENETSAE